MRRRRSVSEYQTRNPKPTAHDGELRDYGFLATNGR
jgi:hypothetical protein